MKKLYFLLIVIFAIFCSNINATKYTINTGAIADLATKITAALSGDTIYIPEGTYDNGDANVAIVDKFITILPDPAATSMPVLKLRAFAFSGTTGAYGLYIKGIKAMPSVNTDYFTDVIAGVSAGNKLKIENCEISGWRRMLIRANRGTTTVGQSLDSIIVRNCIIYNKLGSGTSDGYGTFYVGAYNLIKYIEATNCTFYYMTASLLDVRKSAPTTIKIDHNTFYNVLALGGYLIGVGSSTMIDGNLTLTFTNNVLHKIMDPTAYVSNAGGCAPFSVNPLCGSVTIKNNDFSSFDGATVTYNYSALSTKANVTLAANHFFYPNYKDTANRNFTLPDTSALLTAGTDGKPIGDPRWFPTGAPTLISQNITFTVPTGKIYGDAAFDVTDAVGGASGNPVVLTSSNTSVATISGNTITILAAGTTTITANQAGNGSYSAAPAVQKDLVIGKATATVTLSGLTPTYNATAKTVTATTVPAGKTVDITYAGSATAPTNAGTYAIAATVNDPNYSGTAVAADLVIAKASLTVTTEPATRMKGLANPTFILKYTGFIGSDTKASLTAEPTATCAADANSAVGDYPVVVSGGSADNYTFTYVNGTLSVTVNTGVSLLTGAALKVYPNPVSSTLTIEVPSYDSKSTISVSSVSGATVITRKIESTVTELNLNGIAPGFYLIRIETPEGISIKPVVKQ